MQGYIININRVKDEDLIVTIITQNTLYTTYRFYGARHGTINLGFKIDFELQTSLKSSIARLKDVMHLSCPWIYNHDKLRSWQRFLTLFYEHLKQAYEIDSFYFDLIDEASKKLEKQNAKRVIIEAYTKLLEFEGRLHIDSKCFLCDERLDKNVAIIRAFLSTHPLCSNKLAIKYEGIKELLQNNSSFFLNDKEVEILWNVLLEGF